MARHLARNTGAPIEDVSPNLLESFLPGFGIIRRILEAYTGFDITNLVSSLFIIFAFVGAARYVWRYLFGFSQRWFTASIAISSQDRLFEQVMLWVSKQVVTDNTRALTAKSRKDPWEAFDQNGTGRGGAFNFSDMDATAQPLFAPAYGRHWFWYKGIFFVLNRELHTRFDQDYQEKETIRITCFSRTTAPIKRLILDAKRDFADERRSMTTIRRPAVMGRPNWVRANTRPSRPMDTIYLDENIKSELIEDATEFLAPGALRFYARRGIPYRRGYLFFGPPGTGKTSVSFALAGMLGLELYALSLNDPMMSDSNLGALFSSLPARCVVLMEDVDAAGVKRALDWEDKNGGEAQEGETKTSNIVTRMERRTGRGPAGQDKAGVSLSGLLNAIDGVASQEGRILIMTTNDPEALDKALIRPGRVDMQIYFGYVSRENARRIFVRMYLKEDESGFFYEHNVFQNGSTDIKLEKSEPARIEQLATDFAEALPDMTFTPAEVQGFLLTRRKNAQKALDDVEQWKEELLAARTHGKNIIKTNLDPKDTESLEFQMIKNEE